MAVFYFEYHFLSNLPAICLRDWGIPALIHCFEVSIAVITITLSTEIASINLSTALSDRHNLKVGIVSYHFSSCCELYFSAGGLLRVKPGTTSSGPGTAGVATLARGRCPAVHSLDRPIYSSTLKQKPILPVLWVVVMVI